MGGPLYPKIIRKQETLLSSWLTLVERDVLFSDGENLETYHSFRPHDYVSVLAITRDGRIPLVRQFRPAMEAHILELPGGLLDADQNPEQTALAELKEEAGLIAPWANLLGTLITDSGRLENKYYCYFADNAVPDPNFKPEPRIELTWATGQELLAMIREGTFTNSMHISLFALAHFQGLITF